MELFDIPGVDPGTVGSTVDYCPVEVVPDNLQ